MKYVDERNTEILKATEREDVNWIILIQGLK
jgi:hypothetical protein